MISTYGRRTPTDTHIHCDVAVVTANCQSISGKAGELSIKVCDASQPSMLGDARDMDNSQGVPPISQWRSDFDGG
jgi:hypothetical protein